MRADTPRHLFLGVGAGKQANLGLLVDVAPHWALGGHLSHKFEMANTQLTGLSFGGGLDLRYYFGPELNSTFLELQVTGMRDVIALQRPLYGSGTLSIGQQIWNQDKQGALVFAAGLGLESSNGGWFGIADTGLGWLPSLDVSYHWIL